jgi:hypothetical protein
MGSNRTQKIKIKKHCREHQARYPQKVEKTYHTISPHSRKTQDFTMYHVDGWKV